MTTAATGRIGKKVMGRGQRWLDDGQLRIVAELDGGDVASRLICRQGQRSEYVRAGCDDVPPDHRHLGSPRL